MNDNGDMAIRVSQITKVYRLYDRRLDRLKDSLGIGGGSFREHYALRGVDLEVHRGETVGIIGTNGSGKSTMLKLITGVLAPTSGEIEVDGRISALLELGAGFNMEYTGIENVYLNGMMTGFSKEEIDARLPEILRFADIGDYVYQPVRSYSSGMFVRLAFAVAINIDPEILIVDEALSVGDVFFQAKCYRKFEEFRKQGRTILFVSHDLSAITRYCDRAVLLNKGEKIFEGAPKEAVDIYKEVLVDQYAGAGGNGSADGAADGGDGQGSGAPAAGLSGSGEAPDASKAGQTGAAGSGNGSAAGALQGAGQTGAARNPELLEYGDQRAQIVSYCVLDEKGRPTGTLMKGSTFRVRMTVRAQDEVSEPIFAFTIKNLKGVEICGTNTTMEKVYVPPMKKGDEHTVLFTQKIDLQGGEYLLSLGCTGYQDGAFRVFHRLYDVCSITVVSDRDTVGFYDMHSRVTLDGKDEGSGWQS